MALAKAYRRNACNDVISFHSFCQVQVCHFTSIVGADVAASHI